MDEAGRGKMRASGQPVGSPRHPKPPAPPPLPRTEGTAVVPRKRTAPLQELRDLDTHFRAKFFALFEDPAVQERVKRLLLSDEDKVVLEALKVLLPNIVMQRKDAEQASHGPININLGVPRSRPAIDVTPHV